MDRRKCVTPPRPRPSARPSTRNGRRGSTAHREGPNQGWSLRRKAGDVPVSEYDIKPHGTQPGTDSFFQSHHGVQGEWAKDRKIPGYDYDKQPGILLRDSRKG